VLAPAAWKDEPAHPDSLKSEVSQAAVDRREGRRSHESTRFLYFLVVGLVFLSVLAAVVPPAGQSLSTNTPAAFPWETPKPMENAGCGVGYIDWFAFSESYCGSGGSGDCGNTCQSVWSNEEVALGVFQQTCEEETRSLEHGRLLEAVFQQQRSEV